MKLMKPYNTFQLVNKTPKTLKYRSKIRMFDVKITINASFSRRPEDSLENERTRSFPGAKFCFSSSHCL